MPHALATVQDLEGRLGRALTPAEASRAQVLLGDASARVRAYTRQTFTAVEDDVQVLRPIGTQIRLPRRPVTAITSVTAVGGGNGIPDLTVPGWTWDGLDVIDIAGLNPDVWVSMPAWWGDFWNSPNTYRVTYSHGYDQVPPEVVAVVCQMVMRTLTAPSQVEGLVSERVGQYNYQLQQGTGSAGAAVRFADEDKQALIDAGYKRTAGTIQMRL